MKNSNRDVSFQLGFLYRLLVLFVVFLNLLDQNNNVLYILGLHF